MKTATLGEVKWFGGINKQIGRENEYGFISALSGDVYFHRSHSLSPPDSLMPGAKVLFLYTEGRKGKPAAESVRVLSLIPDAELVVLLQEFNTFPPLDMLTIAMSRDSLSSCETDALQAVIALTAMGSATAILINFWDKFPPESPNDSFYPHAPDTLKAKICKQHYSGFRERLHGLFSSVTAAETSLDAEAVYLELDERDEELARYWAGRDDNSPLLAKMLSARAAERAVQEFYENTGSSVEDISIRQLDGGASDWMTHDLLVDSSISVDVKNARRPVNGRRFYVEHTVARFKLDRRSAHVRIAGVLSPYLSLEYVREPSKAKFKVDDLIFLGETGKDSIDRLVSMFGSPTFELVRAYERTVPHWVFSYPQAWYRAFRDDVSRFACGCEWPEGEEWEHVLDDSEKIGAVPALCVAGKPLPAPISSKLHGWQHDFYARVQSLSNGAPELPIIFLAVLTDFLTKLKGGDSDFSPNDYLPILFARDPGPHTISYPLGAIDPLGLVYGLIKTLAILWANRDKTKLESFSNFRFSGMGILLGRGKDQDKWKTILAYCGGTAFEMDEDGNVLLQIDGKPVSIKGKCGNAPLIIGVAANCPTCGKLVCTACGFCSLPCQKRKFSERAEAAKAERERNKSEQPSNRWAPNFGGIGPPPEWEQVPLEIYKDEFRRR